MTTWDFGVLGALEVRREGVPVELGRPRLRQMLTALLVDPGVPLSPDRLIGIVWTDAPPRTGRAALHNLVGALRRWFREAGVDDRMLLRTGPAGYQLALSPARVDAHRFEGLHADGVAALRSGDAERAASLLDRSLALWRGTPYADLEASTYVQAPATRLLELRATALLDRAVAELERGRAAEAARRLETLVAEDPARERRWELYMLALYRSGRQRDALEAYRRVREHLRDELGADPGPGLRAMHAAILRHDASLQPSDELAAADLVSPRTGAGSLPAPVSSLVGRHEPIGEVANLVAEHRLVVLTGPGGVGKTRLAIAAARAARDHFPAGSRYVPLGGTGEASGVLSAISRGLGLPRVLERGASLPLRERPGDGLLLVLDTLEHLPDAYPLLSELLAATPALTILATSRSPLRLTGEHRYPVPPLAVPGPQEDDPGALAAIPSVALLVERVVAQDPAFVLDTDTAPRVAAWSRSLGGLPLAIELAAARIAETPETVHGPGPSIEDLTSGPVDAPPRQRSIRATLDWSVAQLSEPARTLLGQLSVFRGSPERDAIRSVTAADDHVLDELVRASLVGASRRQGTYRFELLDVVRQYARDLIPSTDETWLRQRHATYYLERLGSDRSDRGGDVAEDDAYDGVAALRHLRTTRAHVEAARLAIGLYRSWREHGDVAEGRRETDAVLRQSGDALPLDTLAELHLCVGFLAAAQGGYADAAEQFTSALRMWGDIGSESGVARTLYGLGGMRYRERAYGEARDLLERGLEAAQRCGATTVQVRSLAMLASIEEAQGAWRRARHRYAEAAVFAEQLGQASDLAQCRASQASLAAVEADHEVAEELATSALAAADASGNLATIGFAHALTGVVMLERGDGQQATSHYLQALDRCVEAGLTHWTLDCLGGLAAAAELMGEPERAATLFAAVDAIHEREAIPVEPGAERESHDRRRRVLLSRPDRARLGPARASGRRMDLDDAVRFARRSVPRGVATVTELRHRRTAGA